MKFHLGISISILLCASAWAQNYEAVIQRLKKSVEAGEISERQAWSMVSALKKSSPAEIRLEHYGRELKAAVKAGKMTEKEAWGKWKMAEAKAKGSAVTDRPNWDQIKKRIEGAVERGDMTRDQANKKYEALKKSKQKKPMLRGQDKPMREKEDGSFQYVPGKTKPDQRLWKDQRGGVPPLKNGDGFTYFPKSSVELELTSKSILLGDREMTIEQLVADLKKRKDVDKNSPIFIKLQEDTSFEAFTSVLDSLRVAGYKNVQAATKPKIQLEPKGGVGYGSGRQHSDR